MRSGVSSAVSVVLLIKCMDYLASLKRSNPGSQRDVGGTNIMLGLSPPYSTVHAEMRVRGVTFWPSPK